MIAAQFLIAIHVFFSPSGGCQQAAIAAIESAQSTVEVFAYTFTSKPVSDVIVAALNRGVKVRAILDYGSNHHNKNSQRGVIAKAGATVVCDRRHAIFHDKIVVVDSHVVTLGSWNFSRAAELSNAENLLVVDDADLAAKYEANFETHYAHAQNCDK
jgi:phosphatidylserine/phosphatidylglycerophosphate/cardiolipin synthase-like enzyme